MVSGLHLVAQVVYNLSNTILYNFDRAFKAWTAATRQVRAAFDDRQMSLRVAINSCIFTQPISTSFK